MNDVVIKERFRIFVGLKPDPQLESWHRALAIKLEPVTGHFPPFANWHITLCYIGSASAAELRAVKKRLTRVDAAAFEVVFDKAVAFKKRRKVAALTLQSSSPPDALFALQQLVTRACFDDTVSAERDYKSHITVSRPKKHKRDVVDGFHQAWDGVVAELGVPTVRAQRFFLINSTLGYPYASYETLASYPLA